MSEIKASAVKFDTRPYECSHGHAPRGRGSWAFHPDANVSAMSPEIIWTPSMTYAEAKKYARPLAAARGWDWLSVLS